MNDDLHIRDLAHYGPVIPVIVLEDLAEAVSLAKALVAGGVRVMEVTLRTDVALESIRAIVQEVPEAIVGAGTITTEADARNARQAGARFMVSPGLTERVAQTCSELAVPLLPGVATASEVMRARELGYTVQKFFPAVACGGLGMLKAWSGPFPDVLFCPTGGIGPDNARDFLALKNVVCVGGSWLVPQHAIHSHQWDHITQLAREASRLSAPV